MIHADVMQEFGGGVGWHGRMEDSPGSGRAATCGIGAGLVFEQSSHMGSWGLGVGGVPHTSYPPPPCPLSAWAKIFSGLSANQKGEGASQFGPKVLFAAFKTSAPLGGGGGVACLSNCELSVNSVVIDSKIQRLLHGGGQ